MTLCIAMMIMDQIGGDAYQPSAKGNTAPFEARQLLERAKEHASRDLLGDRMVLHPAVGKLIHLVDVAIVEAPKRLAVVDGTGYQYFIAVGEWSQTIHRARSGVVQDTPRWSYRLTDCGGVVTSAQARVALP